MLDFRAKLQKDLFTKKKKKGLPQVPELHNIDVFVLDYHKRLYPKGPQQKEKVIKLF